MKYTRKLPIKKKIKDQENQEHWNNCQVVKGFEERGL